MKNNNSTYNLLQKAFYALNRSWFLYICIFLTLTLCINEKKLVFKTLNYLQGSPASLLLQAQNQTSPFSGDHQNTLFYEYRRYYKNLLKIYPESASVHNAVAFTQYHLKNYRAAIDHYLKAISFDSGLFGLHYNLGVIYFHTGHYDRAAESFQEALKTSPESTLRYMHAVNPFEKEKKFNNLEIAENKIAAMKFAYQNCQKFIALSNASLKEGASTVQTVNKAQVPAGLFYYPPLRPADGTKRQSWSLM